MRFDLTLSMNNINAGNILPVNYQYELSSWIYGVLNAGDKEFARWLHEKGYLSDKRSFKLFTFSRLFVKSYHIKADRMIINSPDAKLIISFLPDEAIKPFVKGLFLNRMFTLGDMISQVNFEVSSIEEQQQVYFSDEMDFITVSPIFIGMKDSETGYKNHLSPNHPDFNKCVEENLIAKYLSYYKSEVEKPLHINITPLSPPKEKLIKIKGNTSKQTYIKGYDFIFKAAGSPELIQTGFYAGFGALNSQGFGCANVHQ